LTSDSTDKYIDKAVKRYAKLFGLPTQRRLIVYLALISLHGGVLSILLLGLSIEKFSAGLAFGVLFFVLTLTADYVISRVIQRTDLIFNLRRLSGLSLFSSLVWLGILVLGSALCSMLGSPQLWVRIFFLGFSGALILRLLVLSIVSFAGTAETLFSALFQPLLASVPLFFMESIIGFNLTLQLLVFTAISVSVSLLAVFAFKYFMDRVGTGTLGISSSVLFKAFLANWAEDRVEPMEHFFEQLGNEQDIQVSLLSFLANGALKATFVVPALHPGPFKNLGSSLLPSLLQTQIQDKFNCVASVPHGLVGHELDVCSQPQNQRVINSILSFIGTSTPHSEASPMVRTERGDAKVSCQIFGNCAFLTLTTAPKTMEDLPSELNSVIVGEAEKLGLHALAIDAHNSMNGSFNRAAAAACFAKASVECIEKAVASQRSAFKVGAAIVVPGEFTVRDGMGPGGVSVIAVEVDGQKVAYVTIDGNNMVSGLRDKILSELKTLGIDDGEVLTTDTHSVCGMIRNARGYNLVGEAIDHHKLIGYIKDATEAALANLEPSSASWLIEVIPQVKVIGEQQINELTVLADKTTRHARRLAVTIFPLTAVLLILLLLFLL